MLKGRPSSRCYSYRFRHQQANLYTQWSSHQSIELLLAETKYVFRYYEAKIEEITADGQVSVRFAGYQSLEVTTLGLLKLANSESGAAGSSSGIVNKKEMLAKQKEYLKKRKLKKQERMKKMEQVESQSIFSHFIASSFL